MKTYEWNVDCDGESHKVALRFCRLTGRTLVSIDGSKEFNISRSPFYYLKERKEIFRVGEKQAILVIPVGKAPDIVIDRKYVGSGKSYV